MRLIKPFLILATGLTLVPALGAGLSKEEALSEFSAECTQCAAYNAVSIRCFTKGEDKAKVEETLKFFSDLQYATGKAAGVSAKAIEARFVLAVESIKSDMDSNCVNISVIIKKIWAVLQSYRGKPRSASHAAHERGAVETRIEEQSYVARLPNRDHLRSDRR